MRKKFYGGVNPRFEGKKLAVALEKNKVSPELLAEESKISRNTIYRMLRGESVRDATWKHAWNTFHILSERYNSTLKEDSEPYRIALHNVPIISWTHAGEAHQYEKLTTDWIDQRPTSSKDPKAFGVRVEGDSMEPRIYAGEIAIVTPRYSPRNGDLVIANIKARGVVLKLFHHDGVKGKCIRLSSYNALYPPELFSEEDFFWIYPVQETIKTWRQ